MKIYHTKKQWKILLLLGAMVIGVSSLWVTNRLTVRLAAEERRKVELWSQAIQASQTADDEFLLFTTNIINKNTTVPVILTDDNYAIVSSLNLDPRYADDSAYLYEQLEIMRNQHSPIEIRLLDNNLNYVFYKDSVLLNRLVYFPYIQLGVIVVFMGVAYMAFSSSRNAEQSSLWAGMSKETAHQLATPISSLMAWIEYMKSSEAQFMHLNEIERDVARLQKITERFSMIGSKPKLELTELNDFISQTINYLCTRISRQVNLLFTPLSTQVLAPLNRDLFEWVIENLVKNAVDALSGKGTIAIEMQASGSHILIDVIDSGRGIPKNSFKTVFKPGYSTKKKGWGLGLALARRIVEEYHGGRIFVKHSELNRGTTFRIIINK